MGKLVSSRSTFLYLGGGKEPFAPLGLPLGNSHVNPKARCRPVQET